MGTFSDASIDALFSKIPRDVHVFMEIVGWVAAACLIILIAVAIIKDVRRARRDRKLAAEVLINPEVAYRQILAREKAIADFDSETEKRQAERRSNLAKELEQLRTEFIKKFPFIKQEDIRQYLENMSSANR